MQIFDSRFYFFHCFGSYRRNGIVFDRTVCSRHECTAGLVQTDF